jgi:anti-anti-sigma regulatory factor
MLRITVHSKPGSLTFQLEGTLVGPWVGEVEQCRRRTLAGRRRPNVRFDLAGVTFIDAAGKAYLAAMHRRGAEFAAADCLTKAIVAEIAKAPLPD